MPRRFPFRVHWAAATHPGRRRPSNEDHFGARPDLGLFVVADGMGGHAAGEVASRLAVQAMVAALEAAEGPAAGEAGPPGHARASHADAPVASIREAFAEASRWLAAAVAVDGSLRGMATTMSALLLGDGPCAAIGHVGDSRIYRAREGRVERLTDDHSWVEEQVRAGLLDRQAAARHPWRSVVTRALSGTEMAMPDVAAVDVAVGDRYLLCSDGLHAVVGEGRVADALDGGGDDLAALCDRLVEDANAAGGPDNVTLILVAIHAA